MKEKEAVRDLLIKKLGNKVIELSESIAQLTILHEDAMKDTLSLTEEVVVLQDGLISVLNRLNEIELDEEKQLFVSPVRDFDGEVKTPHAKPYKRIYRPTSGIQRVVSNLKRIIRSYATP